MSGGADSVALMLLMAQCAHRFDLRLEVATLDHGLRPESAAECAQVMSLAASLGLSAHSRSLHLTHGPGLEERARHARYAMLESLREARGLQLVATGHTATDQAESVLMRLGRGATLEGAAGIWAQRGRVIRPLLDLSREEIRAFLAQRQVAYTDDPMNEDLAYLRVRIRQGLLPKLRELFGGSIEQHLAQFADFAHEDAQVLKASADAAFVRLQLPGGALDAVGLKHLERPLARRVIARFLREGGLAVDSQAIETGWAAVLEGTQATVGKDSLLSCQNGQVRLVAAPLRK
ncbi:MAG: tRNA lysidine(34) synthetase TilS [Myxococcaceae bacterium]|nr:tRNA lysidine(34) synthetase TilS [Myxococcaceae bacterium]